MVQRDPKKMMGAVQVSEYLRISLSTVHHLTRAGKLKSEKIGKKWCYTKQDLDFYLEHGHSVENKTDEDRREYERYLCNLHGRLKIDAGKDLLWAGDAVMRNYSLGGALFETTADFQIEKLRKELTQINVDLAIDSKHTYKLNGKLVYFVHPGVTRLGIEFDQSSRESISEVSQFLGVN